jgi:hypothetical protein
MQPNPPIPMIKKDGVEYETQFVDVLGIRLQYV